MKKLNWDSEFFEKNIYTFDKLEELKNLILRKEEIIQKKINKMDIILEKELLKNKFNYIEGEVTFFKELNLNNKLKEEKIIKAQIKDLLEIKEIIRDNYNYSRFNKINKNKVNDFYFKWVENAILGKFDDFCLIIKKKLEIVGFVTIKILNNDSGRIGLIGVAKKYQNEKIGTKLLIEVEKNLMNKKIKKLFVSTQSSNEGAIKFYKKNNFKILNEEKWFYKIGGEND